MRRLSLLVSVAALAGCSGQQSTRSQATAAAPPAASQVAAAKEAEKLPPKPFSLEEFTPLLALPELAKVAEALEQEKDGQAAVLLEKALAEHPPEASRVPSFQFLLGRVRERAGNLSGAAASYDLAAQPRWALSEYARLCAARVDLRRGEPKRALSKLSAVQKQGAIADAARLLEAEAAQVERNYDVAIAAWRGYLDSDTDADRPTVALNLAKALLERHRSKEAGSDTTEGAARDLTDALKYARHAEADFAGDSDAQKKAGDLIGEVLLGLPEAERPKFAEPGPDDQLYRLTALVDARNEKLAIEVADSLLYRLPKSERYNDIGCEARLQRAKALSLARKWGTAAEALADPIARCRGNVDYLARALYLAGKYSAADGRHAQAVKYYEELEKAAPKNSLADDARLLAARSYFELGVEARFTELLTNLPRDYPQGDMVMEGVFELALRRIERGDWHGAASVLELARGVVADRDSQRGQEYSGRERYFLARAWEEMAQKPKALDEYEAIIREVPLSYYMLHAYSRLVDADVDRASKAIVQSRQRARLKPFSFEKPPEFEAPEFQRALELLRVGEIELAKRELEALGVGKQRGHTGLLWGVALLYARAGAVKTSHNITRGLLTDWLGYWPAGDWVKAWQLAFPRPYEKVVQKEAKRYALPEAWIYGVMREESAFDRFAVSSANAHGLMQLIVPTAKIYAKKRGLPYDARSLKRPEVNIALGASALSDLTERFSQTNPLLAIPGYNAGPGRPARWVRERPHMDFDVWVELIPFRETRRYTKRVLASRAAYAALYDPDFAEQAMTLPLKVAQ